MKSDIWQGCSDDGWQGNIVPEAFSHPAKFSRGLIHRIYKHAYDMGWVEQRSWVLDPFAGVGLGALDAITHNLNWIGVELEEKFVKLGEQNIDLWNRQLKGWPNLGTAKIIQGDSRKLRNVIKEASLIVSSPPYIKSQGVNPSTGIKQQKPRRLWDEYSIGETEGQLGSMKEGSFDLCVSSPNFPTDQPCASQTRSKKNYHAFTRGDGTKRDHQMRSEGNLAISGNTFWLASKEIISQCYKLLKPNGMIIWVTKDYIKNKKRVPFSDRWLALCKSVGFKLVCQHEATLVKSYGTQVNIEGNDEDITVERKSFFRRLAESKGSPKIDWEDVICLVKL